MKNLTIEERNNKNNKIDNLTHLCNLNINKKVSYSTSEINKVIDFCLKGFEIASNKIELTINERLMLFIDVRKYTLEN